MDVNSRGLVMVEATIKQVVRSEEGVRVKVEIVDVFGSKQHFWVTEKDIIPIAEVEKC